MPVALIAAYLLVLQSVFGAFASGTMPAATQLDAFGNVICTHDGAAEIPAGDQHQKHMPACCVLGCGMFSPAHAAPPPSTAWIFSSRSFENVAFVSPATGPLEVSRERSPSNPRAPPLAA